eukprot:2923269-Rhodomonas_salina.1
MCFDKQSDEGQTEPFQLGVSSLVERLPHLLELLLRYPSSVVRHFHQYLTSRPRKFRQRRYRSRDMQAGRE